MKTIFYNMNPQLYEARHWDPINRAFKRITQWLGGQVQFAPGGYELLFGLSSDPFWGLYQDTPELTAPTITYGATWQRSGSPQKKQNVAEHELIHALGVPDHSWDPSSIRFAYPGWIALPLRLTDKHLIVL